MPTKDRLAQLRQAANYEEHNAEPYQDAPQVEILEEAEKIRAKIEAIECNTRTCEEALSSTNLFKRKDRASSLDATFKKSETLAYEVVTALKRIKHEIDASRREQRRTTTERIVELQHAGLNERLRTALQAHHECVQRHRDGRKEVLERCRRIVDGDDDVTEEQLEALVDGDGGGGQIFVKDYLHQEREARMQLLEIENRHSELLKIESHLVEVNELFKKIAVLVEQQQENINRVEYHATSATDYIETTVGELREAQATKRKNFKRTTWLTIIVVVLVLILLIGIIY